jgi:hypothetical protein
MKLLKKGMKKGTVICKVLNTLVGVMVCFLVKVSIRICEKNEKNKEGVPG